jgi:hypothetical protein
MNLKLIFKTLSIVAILSLLVLMGMHNGRQTVELEMPELYSKAQKLPAALMYYGFFALGFLAGAIIMVGGGGKGGKSPSKKE